MMLKLKLQYFGHLMGRADSLEKTLMLGGIGGRRRRGRQRMRWLDGITDSMTWVLVNSGSWWWTGRPGVLRFMGSQRVRHDWATDLIWSEVPRKQQKSKETAYELPTWNAGLTWISGGSHVLCFCFRFSSLRMEALVVFPKESLNLRIRTTSREEFVLHNIKVSLYYALKRTFIFHYFSAIF